MEKPDNQLDEIMKWSITSHNHAVLRGNKGKFYFQTLYTNPNTDVNTYTIRLYEVDGIGDILNKYFREINRTEEIDYSFPLIKDPETIYHIEQNTIKRILESRSDYFNNSSYVFNIMELTKHKTKLEFYKNLFISGVNTLSGK